MAIVLNGTTGITTPEITSAGGPLVVNASAPDNSVVVDTSGNVGIGTSSPTRNLQLNSATTEAAIKLTNTTSGSATGDGVDIKYEGLDLTINNRETGAITFETNNTTRARIDSSGQLLFNCTGRTNDAPNTAGGRINEVNGNEKVRVTADGLVAFQFYSPSGGTNAPVGVITVNASSTSYVTTSDYRLKENIAPMTGALEKVAALKPVTYTWKNTGETDEGFIAHELAEVCPSAVTGEKDAVDADGNPVYQGIDTSFLVATLTAAIQEQQAINDAQAQTIESLTTRVVALEGQA